MELTNSIASLPEYVAQQPGMAIPLILAWVGMVIMGIVTYVQDLKTLHIKFKHLLMFVAIGFIGYLASKIATMTFQWYDLLIIPLYVLLEVINTVFNKNHIIGQGDIDIFNGSLALLLPILIRICTQEYDYAAINQLQLEGILLDMCGWIFFGLVFTMVIVLIREFWARVVKVWWLPAFSRKNKKEVKETTSNENSEVEEQEAIVETSGDETDNDEEVVDAAAERKKKFGLKTKVPVALSFMPVYFYMVWLGICCF
jgi:hypothetical protein